jgi:cell wall-associated NlpC family hydrolase
LAQKPNPPRKLPLNFISMVRGFSHSGVLLLALSLLISGCRHNRDLAKTDVTKTDQKNRGQAALHELGLSDKEIRASKLYSYVNEWYGVPYKYGGCQKTGVDCSCFSSNLYAYVYGRKLPRTAGEIQKECEKVSQSKMRQGDLLFFVINGKSVSHVGVYLKDNKFVHASTSKGVIISSLDEAYYKKYFHSAGRLRPLS